MNKQPAFGARSRGFTLIELLVVISIIGVLAAMILPALARAKVVARRAQSLVEVKNILTAINQYESDYHRLPASQGAREIGSVNDFTFGTYHLQDGVPRLLTRVGKANQSLPAVFTAKPADVRGDYRNSNAELMYILRDITEAPNQDHGLNPKHNVYLDVKQLDRFAGGGVGPDGVYRDPFGNPYIVTLDLNGDERCRDAFYRLASVSRRQATQGWNGLNQADPSDQNSFELNRTVMVWSFGPDGDIDANVDANKGKNKDNVLSW